MPDILWLTSPSLIKPVSNCHWIISTVTSMMTVMKSHNVLLGNVGISEEIIITSVELFVKTVPSLTKLGKGI